MARRKKKVNISPQHIKIAIIIIVGIGILIAIYFGITYVFLHAKIFSVKSVSVDPSLSFISKRDYNKFIGTNIFEIDLAKNNKRLSYKYPQIDGLKVVRRFPDRILLVARQRMPFAQIKLEDKVLTIDDRGVLLSTTSKLNDKLPNISGVAIGSINTILGKKVVHRNVKTALMIINRFTEAKTLSSYEIAEIDVSTLSKIEIELSNGLIIFLGKEDIGYKISVLNLLISQHKFTSRNTKYIDLRFKEPVIGKK